MTGPTGIAWTDLTLNPGIYGCSPVGAGCLNCYAARMAWRLEGMGQRYYRGRTRVRAREDGRWIRNWTGEVQVDKDRMQAAFERLPKRAHRTCFVTSMADLFHEQVPASFQCRVFNAMLDRENIDFLVLTKRLSHAIRWWDSTGRWYVGEDHVSNPWPTNIHLGASASTQRELDQVFRDLREFRKPPLRFVSLEPLIERVDLGILETAAGRAVDWVIVGCETGPYARPCSLAWIESLVEQAHRLSVPLFVKQIRLPATGGDDGIEERPEHFPPSVRVRQVPQKLARAKGTTP